MSALCDAALLSAGVLGFGAIVSRFPLLTQVAAWAGAVFLVWYAIRAFRLLNPHVWLDTVGSGLGALGGPVG